MSRLQRLMGFLEQDPANLRLLADAASAAFDEGAMTDTTDLIGRYAALAPLPPALRNLEGLAALSSGRFEAAQAAFAELAAANPADPRLRFNQAWSSIMVQDYLAAVALLDDPAVLAVAPGAAGLKVQALHHLGKLDEALEFGAAWLADHPAPPDGDPDRELMSALSVVAIDAEQPGLARTYAEAAGDASHEGLSTLGMLALSDKDVAAAMALFDRSLAARRDGARGLMGKGLGLLLQGDNAAGAKLLDESASIFGTHLGTWVAAAWAQYALGDLSAARERFERAMAVDDTFAEIHGGLAVIDIAEGNLDSARRRADIAQRLDPRCLSAALARSLLANAAGDTASAERIQRIALSAPLGDSGESLAEAMVGMAGKSLLGRPPGKASLN